MRLHERVEIALRGAARSTERTFTHRLQQEALASGWPKEAAGSLQVTHEDGRLRVTHDGHDWEFGVEDRPPLAVTRHFLHHLHEHADPHFSAEVARSLRDLL